MFKKIQNKEQSKELEKLNLQIKMFFGMIPSNFELLGNIDVNLLKDLLAYIGKLKEYESIHPDYFTFLRLFVASQEGFNYCIGFNTKILVSREYSLELIENCKNDLQKLPLDENHKVLAIKSIKSIFDSKNFEESDFNELYSCGWSDKEIFASIEHAGFMLKNGRILEAYSIKS